MKQTTVIYTAGPDNQTLNEKLHEALYLASTWLNMSWVDSETAHALVNKDEQARAEPTGVNPDDTPDQILTFSDTLPGRSAYKTVLTGLRDDDHASNLIITRLNDLPDDDKQTVGDTVEHIVSDLEINLHIAKPGWRFEPELTRLVQ